MSKKKDEDVVSEKQQDAAKVAGEKALKAAEAEIKNIEKTVSVEMTESQRDRVVQILAEEQLKKDKGQEVQPIAVIDLRFSHRRNGQQYGPGVVKCPADIAASLVAQDHKHYDRRLKDAMGADHSIKILGHGKAQIITTKGVV